jgi:ATP-dependent RNA helicase RhlB
VQQRQVFLDQVEVLVLDEADRLLDMGFIPQVKRIVGYCPGHFYRQTLLFSATFSTDILALAHRWTRDPVMVEIEPESVAQASVEQRIYLVEKKDKWQMLQKILREQGTTRTIVFANRRDQTQRLFERLQRAGFQAGILTGDVPQRKRDRTLEEFKKGSIDILVATDVAGRGIHVDEVSHVINYHLPDDPEDYVHRIGRTGRAGATGISISLACEDESFQLPAIEALLGEKLKCELPPSD